jgi:hypothetical protein
MDSGFSRKSKAPSFVAHGGLDGAVSGNHDYFGWVIQFSNSLQGLQAIGSGQPDIQQHHFVGVLAAQKFEAFFAAVNCAGFVTLVRQNPLQRFTNRGFVIHNQNFMHVEPRQRRAQVPEPPVAL